MKRKNLMAARASDAASREANIRPIPAQRQNRIVSKLPCSLDGLNQLTHGGLRVAIQHASLIEHEQRIVYT